MEQELKRSIPVSEPNIAIANIYTLIAGLVTVFFIVFFYFVVKNLFLSGVMFLLLIGVMVNYIILSRTKNNEIATYTLLSMGAVIMFSLFAGGWENMGLIWPFAWLPATFWMNKGKGGRIFIFIFFAGTLIITALHFLGIIVLPYSPATLVNFFSALAVFAALMILYQNATITYETFLAYKHNLFETSLDPMIIVDGSCKISDFNRATEKITGISRKKLMHSDFSSYFSEPEKLREICKRAVSEGSVHNFPLTIFHADGGITDILVNTTVYREEKAKTQKIFIVIRDVTEIKEAERKKVELFDELEKVNRDLEAFSYSVSHDLRAPLRSLDGYTKILMEDYSAKLDDEGIKIINIILSNTQKMGNLIDDLLAFSRLGRQDLIEVSLDMNVIVHALATELKSQHPRRKIKIDIKPLLNAPGDSSMVRQVMVNLISNAIKYSGKKEVSIIEIGSYEQGGDIVYFVKDNGAGFEMQYYNKLFGVFQRLHDSDDFEGTGVGLAIVQRIVARHNGKVWAEGKLDEGATFYFSLPALKNQTKIIK